MSIEGESSVDIDDNCSIWEDMLEDDELISEIGGEERVFDLGESCPDFKWDERSAVASFDLVFNFHDKDDVSELEGSIDDRSTDSTILSV